LIKIILTILFVCIIFQQIEIIALRKELNTWNGRNAMAFAKIISCLYADNIRDKAKEYFKIYAENKEADPSE